MFLPENVDKYAKEEKERKQALERIEAWSMEMIPVEIRDDAFVAVREMECGDPNCSPIDTAVTIFFEDGGDGILCVHMMAKEITKEDLKDSFPTAEVLRKWKRGEDAEWPPYEDELPPQRTDDLEPRLHEGMPKLRFDVGTRVLCRTGPEDWLPGTITLLWYRDIKWPEGAYAPYMIRLDDDRSIFAPSDVDEVIKRETAREAANE